MAMRSLLRLGAALALPALAVKLPAQLSVDDADARHASLLALGAVASTAEPAPQARTPQQITATEVAMGEWRMAATNLTGSVLLSIRAAHTKIPVSNILEGLKGEFDKYSRKSHAAITAWVDNTPENGRAGISPINDWMDKSHKNISELYESLRTEIAKANESEQVEEAMRGNICEAGKKLTASINNEVFAVEDRASAFAMQQSSISKHRDVALHSVINASLAFVVFSNTIRDHYGCHLNEVAKHNVDEMRAKLNSVSEHAIEKFKSGLTDLSHNDTFKAELHALSKNEKFKAGLTAFFKNASNQYNVTALNARLGSGASPFAAPGASLLVACSFLASFGVFG